MRCLAKTAGLVLVSSLLGIVVGCGAGGMAGDGANHPAVGKTVEVVRLQPLTGDSEPVSGDDLVGKVTLLNFWGPWCGPCQIEFPHLADLERHFRPSDDFLFLSVSCSGDYGTDEIMQESTEEFLKSRDAEFPTYRDADLVSRGYLEQKLRLQGIGYPTTVILDRDRKVRGLWIGYRSGSEREMRRVIEQALAETPAGAADPEKTAE